MIAPIVKRLGIIPMVKVFTVAQLRETLRAAGFELAHQWQPGKGKAMFIVALKLGLGAAVADASA